MNQHSTLSTTCDLELRWVPILAIEVVIFRPITNVHFDLGEFRFAFGAITPVTILLSMLLMQAAECIFTVITSTNVEDMHFGIVFVFRGFAEEMAATFGLNKRTPFATKTTVRTLR